MVFDYKKEYRDLYQPASEPSIITVPRMNFVAVEGAGDPNETGGAYQTAVQLLYGISYTIKMSKKAKDPSQRIDGYFDYVVPPLEGLWWMDGINGIDYAHKARFNWIAMIRLPEFVTHEAFARARQAYSAKHPEADVLVVRRSDSNIDVVAPDGVFAYTERSGGRIRR
ncbi:hypothetical protein [Bifidobacterium pullorum]|uniref:hypothetical protein n=1 Tax=Bifidobacterium pullorum TaxID=78448 RepID=UPI003F52747E